MNQTKIWGTGSYVPEKVLTNADIAKMVDTDDEWIVSRTGIRERRIVAEGESCSDMAYQASLKALAAANLEPQDIDMIIFSTMTPDKRLPASACLLQDKLKATRACVYDINIACSGFVYALSIADQFIKTGAMKRILIVGSEVMSAVVDWTDRSTCILFGDGSGAVVVGPAKEDQLIAGQRHLLSTHLFSDGSLAHLLEIPGGGSATEWTPEGLEKKEHFVKMKGKEVFKEAVKSMASASQLALEKAGFTMDDVAIFVPHQANARIVKAIAKRIHCPAEKIFVNLDKYGNTSGASIAIALDEVVRSGRVKDGDLMLLSTFGAGFAWGAALIRW